MVDAIGGLLGGAALSDVMQRQTGVVVARSDTRQADGGPLLRPLYREVTFSIAALEAKIAGGGQATADPFLFRHLARRLDARMLAQLARRDRRRRPAATRGGRRGAGAADAYPSDPARHPVRRLRPRRRAVPPPGRAVGVEVALVEACGDAARFGPRPRRLAGFGLKLVLGGVSHLASCSPGPGRCAPTGEARLVAPRSARCLRTEERCVAGALERIGPDRVVLGAPRPRRRCGGAERRHAPLPGASRRCNAGGRAASLPARRGTGCALRQCVERSAAVAGRAGCRAP